MDQDCPGSLLRKRPGQIPGALQGGMSILIAANYPNSTQSYYPQHLGRPEYDDVVEMV